MTNLDKLLKQHFGAEDKPSLDAQIDQWLAEDLTAEYDRIVAQQEAAAESRPVRKRLARWLTAAAAIALLIGMGVWLWPKEKTTSQQQMAKVVEKKTLHQTTLHQTTLTLHPSMKGEAPAPPCMEGSNYSPRSEGHATQSEVKESPQLRETPTPDTPAATTDSLDFYLARLEKSLDEVSDSLYQERAEQIIRADARLQRLVRRIYMDDIERQRQAQEAMYLHY